MRLRTIRLATALAALLCLAAAAPAAETASAGAPAPAPEPAPAPTPEPEPTDDGGAWESTSLAAWGLTDALRAHGDVAALGGTLHARRDRVLTAARLVLELAPAGAGELPREVTGLLVQLGEDVVARLDREELLRGPRRRTIEFDANGLGDANPFQLSFRSETGGACQARVPVGTWGIVRAARLEVRSEPLPQPDDLSLLPLPFYDDRADPQPTLHVVFVRPPEPGELRAAALVASYFGRLAGERRLRVTAHVGTLPAEHAVVLTTTGALPDGSAAPGAGAPAIALRDGPGRRDGAPRKLLVLAGRDAAALEQAARRLSDVAWGAAPLQGAEALVEDTRAALPSPAETARPGLVDRREVLVGDLVEDPATLVHRGHHGGTIAVPFRLTPALMQSPPDSVVIDLVYSQRVPQGATPPRVDLEVNGLFVETLRSDAAGPDGALARRRIRLPGARLRGTNWLRVHVSAAQDDDLCVSNSRELVETTLHPDSRIRLDGQPAVPRLPDIDAFLHDGLPFTADPDLGETTVVVPQRAAPEELGTAISLVAGLAALTDRTPAGVRFLDEGEVLRGGSAGRDLLVVAAASRSAFLARWSGRLPLAVRDGRFAARAPTATDWALELLRARWPGAETDRAMAWLAGLRRPVALMGMESPDTPGRSVVIVTAATPRELPATIDPQRYLAPRFPGGADLVLSEGADAARAATGDGAAAPETRAFLVGATYLRGGVDTYTWALWAVSEHWVALVPALLLAALFLALLLRRWLRRVEAQRLAPGNDELRLAAGNDAGRLAAGGGEAGRLAAGGGAAGAVP